MLARELTTTGTITMWIHQFRTSADDADQINLPYHAATTTSKAVSRIAMMRYHGLSFTWGLLKNSEPTSGQCETPSNFATILKNAESKRAPAGTGL